VYFPPGPKTLLLTTGFHRVGIVAVKHIDPDRNISSRGLSKIPDRDVDDAITGDDRPYNGLRNEKISPQLAFGSCLGEAYRIISGISRYLRSFGSGSGIVQTFPHIEQLPNEKPGLQNGNAEQQNGERRQSIRIVRDPLRFKSEFFVDFRFLLALAVLLFGLLLGVLGGEYFYRERYLVGAALMAAG
jgi:hypothetical protein